MKKSFFGGSGKMPDTPDGMLEALVKQVKDGKLDVIAQAVDLPVLTQERVERMNGLIKGYAAGYTKKLFAKTVLHATDVEMQGDMQSATVLMEGKTVDILKLVVQAEAAFREKDDELGLLSGQKLNLRKIGTVLGLVDSVLKQAEAKEVSEKIPMECREGVWEVTDPESLNRLLLGCNSEELMQLVEEKFGPRFARRG